MFKFCSTTPIDNHNVYCNRMHRKNYQPREPDLSGLVAMTPTMLGFFRIA